MPQTYCPCPRPILKRSTHTVPSSSRDDLLHIDPSVLGQPTVRFPPHDTLVTRTFLAHSRDVYDRSPIVVSPNTCKLPERGCPGRTYLPPSSPSTSAMTQSFAKSRRSSSPRRMPALVPDLTSSSSDESDGFVSPPLETMSMDTYSIPTHKASPTSSALAIATTISQSSLSIPHSQTSTGLSISPPSPTVLSNPTSPVYFRSRSTTHIPSRPRSRSRSRSRSPARSLSSPTLSSSPSDGATPDKRKRKSRARKVDAPDGTAYKSFRDFEGRSVLDGCRLDVGDGGCFGGF